MKYAIVETGSLEDLHDQVNEWIDKGWKPQGGICVQTYTENRAEHDCFYQAIVKDD